MKRLGIFRRVSAFAGGLLLVVALTGCVGGDGGGDAALTGAEPSNDGGEAKQESGGDGVEAAGVIGETTGFDVDAAFANDDIALIAFVKSTGATDGQWNGDVLQLTYAEDSKDGPTAAMYCRMAEDVLPDGKSLTQIYPDGELSC